MLTTLSEKVSRQKLHDSLKIVIRDVHRHWTAVLRSYRLRDQTVELKLMSRRVKDYTRDAHRPEQLPRPKESSRKLRRPHQPTSQLSRNAIAYESSLSVK